jgi:hypothetical protein
MKSEERHKLKSNELAQSIMELPDYFRKQGKKWITLLVVVLVVLVGLTVFRSSRLAAQEQRSSRLQNLVVESKKIQRQAIESAQSGAASDDFLVDSFDDSAGPLANELANLAQESSGKPVKKTALLQRARLLRSQLFYTNSPISPAKKQELLSQVESIYQSVLLNYSHDVIASGSAQIGLALVAEDRLQWDQARQAYQAILDEAEGKWSGTIFPSQASLRLQAIGELENEQEIIFQWVEELPVAETLPDETVAIAVDTPDEMVGEVEAEAETETETEASTDEAVVDTDATSDSPEN